MNKNSLPYFVLLALAFAVSPWVHAQSQEDQPLEVINYRIAPGTNSLGIPLLRPAKWKGKVASVSPVTRVVADVDPQSSGPILGQLPLESAYLEITASPLDPTLVGERFEVGILKTRGSLGNSGQIYLLPSVWDTRPDVPSGLVGCSYEIHPHWTLASFLGTAENAALRKGKSSAYADLVRIPLAGETWKLESFFIHEDRGAFCWRNSSVRTGPDASATVIPPGVGVQIVIPSQGAAEKPLVLLGEARKHAFRRPLQAGRNLVALGHLAPQSLNSILARSDYGFQPGISPDNADEILFRNHGRWEVLRYTQDSSSASWQCLTARYGGKLEDLPLLPPHQAFWINKVRPDSDFIIPPPAP